MKTGEKSEYSSAVKSRKLIKNALSELLQKKDFETISVTEIVKAAGINRSTFYAHYNNMTEVLEEIEKQVADGILNSFMSYKESVMENPTPFLKSIASLLQKDFDFYKRLICANVGSHFIDKLKELFINTVIGDNDKINHIKDLKTFGVLVRFYTNGFCSMFEDAFKGTLKISLENLAEIIGEIVAVGFEDYTITKAEKIERLKRGLPVR